MYNGYTESQEKLEERRRRILDGTYGRRPAEPQQPAEYPKVMTPDGEQFTFYLGNDEQPMLL